MASRGYAQWMRCDVHVHTPFDRTKSFGEDTDAALAGQERGDDGAVCRIAARFYESCRKSELALVGMTDHNGCDGHRALKPHLDELNRQAAANGESTVLFLPGVEVTVGSERPIHVLLLFDEAVPFDDIDRCIAQVFRGRDCFESATRDPAAANCTVPDFLAAVREFCRPPTGERSLSYVVIPAHVERHRGIVQEIRGSVKRLVIQHQDWNGFQTNGPFSKQSRDFQGMLTEWVAARLGRNWEDLDSESRDGISHAAHWPLVQASDPARYEDIGTDFTWLKMEEPSLEGLRLALLDPESRLRSAADGCPACEYPQITQIRIQNSVLFDDMSLPTSPQLNTLIGGRGTGKSSVLEYVRHCLDRARSDDFVSGTETVREELGDFLKSKPSRTSDKPGTLLESYEVTLGLRVAGSDYRIQRNKSGLRVLRDGIEVDAAHVDIRTLIEPVIMSQRQMAAIARDPEAQRLVLDSLVSPRARRECADARQSASDELEEAQRHRDSLVKKIIGLTSLRTQRLQLQGHIEALQAPGCEATLEQREQTATAEAWLDKAQEVLNKVSENIHHLADDVERDSQSLPTLTCEGESWLKDARDSVADALGKAQDALLAAAQLPATAASKLQRDREVKWQPDADRLNAEYEELVERLSQQGTDLTKRSEFNDQRREVQEQIDALAHEAEDLEDKKSAVTHARDSLAAAAGKMSAARREVVADFAAEQSDIQVEVREMRDRRGLARQRETWFAGTGMHSRDWESVVDFVMSKECVIDGLHQVVEALRHDCEQANTGDVVLTDGTSELVALLGKESLSGHYMSAVGHITADTLNRIERYIPEDSIETRFRDNDGAMKPLENASLGQKSTAILALLLTAGTQPLIIDQPEDDIDNRYVYDVVVGLLRQRKFQRQIIVASHNANIPVNGDAEMIAVLSVEGGLGELKHCGSIDSLAIKELVNDVMEGSREAFALRRERYGF